MIFRRLDDLVDLVRDLKSGGVNSILLRAAGTPEEVRNRILEGELIRAEIQALAADLTALVNTLDGPHARPLRDVTLAYVRSWGD